MRNNLHTFCLIFISSFLISSAQANPLSEKRPLLGEDEHGLPPKNLQDENEIYDPNLLHTEKSPVDSPETSNSEVPPAENPEQSKELTDEAHSPDNDLSTNGLVPQAPGSDNVDDDHSNQKSIDYPESEPQGSNLDPQESKTDESDDKQNSPPNEEPTKVEKTDESEEEDTSTLPPSEINEEDIKTEDSELLEDNTETTTGGDVEEFEEHEPLPTEESMNGEDDDEGKLDDEESDTEEEGDPQEDPVDDEEDIQDDPEDDIDEDEEESEYTENEYEEDEDEEQTFLEDDATSESDHYGEVIGSNEEVKEDYVGHELRNEINDDRFSPPAQKLFGLVAIIVMASMLVYFLKFQRPSLEKKGETRYQPLNNVDDSPEHVRMSLLNGASGDADDFDDEEEDEVWKWS
ncbi:Oidioi.mRNA.OKI2018_I69.XSR.g15064.t1.cds [Oikopleura dioica]|uniref:Oidioi.mRNA.OKI2018_I69.XSR.g15064.t1.cds n=1 Tax=Oikopleura dioica TaxID=34765 RepID=A0ABN7SBM4_OIKDI|nr:Oidioi.mRNA.OKI2018_I69.XSR.g15064.t1.cds [Oikopleura dioica]